MTKQARLTTPTLLSDQTVSRLLQAYGVALHECGAPVNILEERLADV
ncbi:MAG: hypothetical protein ACI9OJ_005367, partial [Myxococcota bacterium]